MRLLGILGIFFSAHWPYSVSAAKQPNIILFLTDDQDVLLGGYTPMTQTKLLMNQKGATASNWYIHTPICCPSRGELLSGRYFHNIRTEKDKGGCQKHLDEDKVNNVTFAKYLSDAGYTVGMFGKYLNNCPKEPQPGFDEWFANGGGAYYKPTFYTNNGTWNGNKTDYTTSVVGNRSIAWIQKVASESKPFMAFIAPKAPHGPATPATWYSDSYPNVTAPRTPSFNVHGADHHHTVSKQHKMDDDIISQVDDIYARRWRCLLSVDDMIAGVINAVEELGIIDNTYFFYTSDHGYQMGELQLACDKRNIYEFDVRIHMVMRGPGIRPNSVVNFIASNVDVGPTLVALAGAPQPATMDGRSFLSLIIDPNFPRSSLPQSVQDSLLAHDQYQTQYIADYGAPRAWRDAHFIEYYNVVNNGGCGMLKADGDIDDDTNNFIGLRVQNEEYGNILYSEFQTDKGVQVNFSKPDFYEMYDMVKDPWQLHNIYNDTDPAITTKLHTWLHTVYACEGDACP